MLSDLITIDKDELCEKIKNIKDDGYRFVALTCEKEGEDYEFIYHFDLNYHIKNVKIIVKIAEPIESVSSIYPSAFLIENEYQDLYGFTFNGLTIDYKGSLYMTLDSPKSPMADEKKD